MPIDALWDTIRNPPESFALTEALRSLLALCKSDEPPAIPADVMEFLEAYVTREPVDAALIGLILDGLAPSRMSVPFPVVMRIFPILYDPFEPALIRLAVEALKLRTPEGLYRKAALLTARADVPEIDRHYANQIIGRIAFEDVRPSFLDYLPAADAASSAE